MMRKYETIFILHPSLDEEAVKANIEKFKGVIEKGYLSVPVLEVDGTSMDFKTANDWINSLN